MLFIAIFAVGSLAIPIFFEIYLKGNDNLVARSSHELIQSGAVESVAKLAKGLLKKLERTTSNYVAWAAGIFGILFAAVAALEVFL